MKRNGWVLAGLSMLAALLILLGAGPVQAENPITVTTTADVVDENDGECSLREAIITANDNQFNLMGECTVGSATDTDVIQLEAGETYTLSLGGAGEDFALTGDLDIIDNATPEVDVIVRAVGDGTAVVQMTTADRVWHVHGAGFALEGVQTGGGSADLGGGLYNDDGRVTATDSFFTLNSAQTGAALNSKGANADLRLTNVEVSRNNASVAGGGVYNETGILILIDSNISGNMSVGSGGGVLNSDGSATLTRTRVAGNETGGCGGGIANVGTAVMTLIESEVTGSNKADGAGGGVCNEATLSITQGSVVSTNEAQAGGGGVFNSGDLTLRSSIIENNQALDPDMDDDGMGGGLFMEGGQVTATQSAIVNNDAATAGGGVAASGTILLFNTTIGGNFAGATGGLFVMDGGEATLANVTLADNEALVALSGTGLHVLNGAAAVGNSIVANTTQDFDTCSTAGGEITSLGYNLSDDATCFNEESDIVDADPMLAPLSDGARMPQAGSPAVDAADPVICSETAVANVDQLGRPRPLLNGCDIGAVEWPGLQLYLPVVVR